MKTKKEILHDCLESKKDSGAKYERTSVEDAVFEAMDQYASPYKKIAEQISEIFHYGHFKAETKAEQELEQMLTEVGLWPTTEDEILKRDQND